MCFLAGISNFNVSHELEEKTSDQEQLNISKFLKKERKEKKNRRKCKSSSEVQFWLLYLPESRGIRASIVH